MTEADYGYLFCWAENIAGRQREPCRFEVVRESPPDPPIYCQPLNVTREHIEATCQPGNVHSETIRFLTFWVSNSNAKGSICNWAGLQAVLAV